jgi:tRNA1Val (adenine37-N6)-methyltransferase
VNVDTLLLAAFAARSGPARFTLDLGSGVGGVMLALHRYLGIERGACVERDRTLAALCAKNLKASGMDVLVYTVDLAKGLPSDLETAADLVVVNPPFFEPDARRPSANRARETALAGSVAPFLDGARKALGRRGRAVFVYPARELVRFLKSAEERGLVAKRMRLVHPKGDAPARVALIELKVAKPGGLVVEPPLVEWMKSGRRSSELSQLIAGRVTDRK